MKKTTEHKEGCLINKHCCGGFCAASHICDCGAEPKEDVIQQILKVVRSYIPHDARTAHINRILEEEIEKACKEERDNHHSIHTTCKTCIELISKLASADQKGTYENEARFKVLTHLLADMESLGTARECRHRVKDYLLNGKCCKINL